VTAVLERPPAEAVPRQARARTSPVPAADDGPKRTRSLRSIDAARVATGLALVVILVGFGVCLAWGIDGGPALSDDEGTYVAQAWALLRHGELAHYTYWYDHPPLGWIQLAAMTAIAGPALDRLPLEGAVLEARALMVLPAVVSGFLVFVVSRRAGLARPAALLAVALFAFSPLTVTTLRQVLLDNLALPWALAALALVLDPARRLWSFAGAGVCLGVAVLSKETFLLLLPAVAVAVWQQSHARTRAFCLTAAGAAAALVVVAYPLLAALKGELLPGDGHVSLVEAVQFQLGGRTSTGSALVPGTGSHELVAGWLRIDPVVLAAGCVLAPVALMHRRLRPVALAVVVLAVVAARPGYLPHPYVAGLLPFCAIVVAGGAGALWRAAARRRAVLVVPVAVAMAIALGLVGRTWANDLAAATSSTATTPVREARAWVIDNVDPRARVLVDDTLFVDLAEAGFEPGLGVVWFYKLSFSTNLDPSVTEALPGGYRVFDYVVSTPVVRSAVDDDPAGLDQVRLAVEHSEVVATFGTGDARVEVRRLVGDGLGSGRLEDPDGA
jgi:4-amino-4-deoxy-L-arabinose transferase-like glycosyltransferase